MNIFKALWGGLGKRDGKRERAHLLLTFAVFPGSWLPLHIFI